MALETQLKKNHAAVLRPRLPPHIAAELADIEPSIDGGIKYFPCSVSLKDGRTLDRVIIVSQASYIGRWGTYPEDDPNKNSIHIEDVASAAKSPSRLPARFANLLYESFRPGSDYIAFWVVFSDGTRKTFLAGALVDFVDYPKGKTTADVVDAQPNVRPDQKTPYVPESVWCLYSDDETDRILRIGLANPIQPTGLSLLKRLTAYYQWWKLRRLQSRIK